MNSLFFHLRTVGDVFHSPTLEHVLTLNYKSIESTYQNKL